jgi:hypothetical protein
MENKRQLLVTVDENDRATIKSSGSAHDHALMILGAIKKAYDGFPDNVASIFKGVVISTIEDERYWERDFTFEEEARK